MNLQIATVLSCTDTGCIVQPLEENESIETRYSKPVVKYNIPIRPNQFVIVDRETTPPETIFRWTRAKVTKVNGDRFELDDDGRQLLAKRGFMLEGDLQVGDDVLVKGYNDENRAVLDRVVDGKPSNAEKLASDWFPTMKNAAERATE